MEKAYQKYQNVKVWAPWDYRVLFIQQFEFSEN